MSDIVDLQERIDADWRADLSKTLKGTPRGEEFNVLIALRQAPEFKSTLR